MSLLPHIGRTVLRFWRRPPAIAAGEVTGTVAFTEGADTVVASGTTTVTGAVAFTEGLDTVAASGTTTVTGTVAFTEDSDTVAASGATTVVGTVTFTEGADTVAASGTTTVTGTVAFTEGADTVLASGTAGSVTGTVAFTEEPDTVAASGTAGAAVVGHMRPFRPRRVGRKTYEALIEERRLEREADVPRETSERPAAEAKPRVAGEKERRTSADVFALAPLPPVPSFEVPPAPLAEILRRAGIIVPAGAAEREAWLLEIEDEERVFVEILKLAA